MNPWQPIKDSFKLALLGKLIEELGELTAASGRCIIQGIDEVQPVTQKLNREWLGEEIADVIANCYFVRDYLGLDKMELGSRIKTKTKHLEEWHHLIHE